MKKRLPSGFLIEGCLMGLAAWLWSVPTAVADPCTVNCRSGQIQFTPGDRVTVQVVNVGSRPLSLEQPPLLGPRLLYTGNSFETRLNWAGQPKPSFFFWSQERLPVRVRLNRPSPDILRVELYDAPSEPSDRSITIEPDGRVSVK
ncbi:MULTISPECIES: hypothetical protein [Cyanophyceae]|uniref:Uncharacterized protein n=1 Tax=Leptolyngbya subtilissima DQ-A4 TaxID=2933933 RepID=A0ABV0K3Y2_9CYAN|nr:hypothetical protein [Nodosilinea sp. FACHB-141]MBD2113212.1 hypothetical protein [Nodosilinea sp. FACHB-141]